MFRYLLSGAATCVLVTAMAPAGAQAQTVTSQTVTSQTVTSQTVRSQSATGVAAPPERAPSQEVVVTAQRRGQSAQDVGIALTVPSGQDLTQAGVNTVNQLQNVAPSLEVEPAFGSGQPQFRIRGVGFQDYQANNAPTVGIYTDDVAYPIPVMTQGALFDIARVEVLRGPQGKLLAATPPAARSTSSPTRPPGTSARESRSRPGTTTGCTPKPMSLAP